MSKGLYDTLPQIDGAVRLDELRGIEGKAAEQYFSVFNDMILNQKEDFIFTRRSRRPPLDNINELLSFAYTVLAHCPAWGWIHMLGLCTGTDREYLLLR